MATALAMHSPAPVSAPMPAPMRVAVTQPYIFPALSYYQLVRSSDIFILYDDVNYISRGFINRNTYLDRGVPRRFTLPVPGASINRKIMDLQYSGDVKSIIEGIRHAYARSPYFQDVFPLIRGVLEHHDRDITSVCRAGIMAVFDYLGHSIHIPRAAELDYNRSLPAADRLVEICHLVGGGHYINSQGGKKLYDKESFSARGIQLSFLNPRQIEYDQGAIPFVPQLSIIDILMRCSRAETRFLLDEYDLE
ncbi:WbqC family protein [Halomonas sp. RA08-2]